MVLKLTPKARHAAATSSPTYTLREGPRVADPRRKLDHVTCRPDVVLHDGRTLVQPRLPTLLTQFGLTETRHNGRVAPPVSDKDRAAEDFAEAAAEHPEIMFMEHTPMPDPAQHRRKQAAQWERWQCSVLPILLPEFARLLHETKSLRDLDGRHPQTPSSIEDVEIYFCDCTPAAVQLMRLGAFGCAPMLPSLAMDLRVLEFAMNLFLQISPNNTAFSLMLERVLGNMGFQLGHQNSLRRRFANCLMWYSHLRNLLKHHYSGIIDTTREELVGPEVPASPSPRRRRSAERASSWGASPRREQASGRAASLRRQRSSSASTASSSSTPPAAAATATPTIRRAKRGREPSLEAPQVPFPDGRAKRGREPSLEAPQVPFPEPPPRLRPSEYLRRRCPACFSNLKHDPLQVADVHVCIDACFTQKKKKSPRDPPKKDPDTHFIPEEQTARTEAYVDSVRNVSQKSARARKRRAGVQAVEEEEEGYEHERLLLPRSVLDGCEASFKAADEKWQKASTEFFEDTALMALVCRHDCVLWVVNMHTAGERQFNVVALTYTLFQHLPHNIRVGLLYDVACAFERSCLKWGFLSPFIDRIAFAVSVFHAFGHEWACQLLYHPRKRVGFGYTNGEGCERFWQSIRHLIPHLRISGYHNRLYILDAQIEHTQEASLFRLVEWICRRYRHSVQKRADATEALQECGKPKSLLREQWKMQVIAQTKPLPRRTKTRGQQAVNTVMLLRAAVKTRQGQVRELRQRFLEAVQHDHPDAAVCQAEYLTGQQALEKAEGTLRRKEEALGVDEHEELEQLTTNAKLHAHTESAVKRREPTITKLVTEYNKLCAQIAKLIRDANTPSGSMAPIPIPPKGLWQVDVDDTLFQDVGIDNDTDEPSPWLSDEKVRAGIKALLELDRCDEEDTRLQREKLALQVWFREEWEIITEAIKGAGTSLEFKPDLETQLTATLACDTDEYHLRLQQDRLVCLCATWDKCLPDMGVQTAAMPSWGPSAAQLARCRVDAHLAASGEDRHYGEDNDEGDGEVDPGEESGGEDNNFGMLDAMERADIYRNNEADY
ncbi:hypothetical protein B0H14DRAFT_3137678 [Mycena olivaceomarginata]|nr:hypothetical protein B0H14DRAFT_3137678 [Mycena olivaceomarginata]